nr:hypothetical protein [Bacillus sp. FJAT-50079]
MQNWIIEALKANENSATLLDICKYVWKNYEEELRKSGDLFYTWQYDIRWAATKLRKDGRLLSAKQSPKGVWELS